MPLYRISLTEADGTVLDEGPVEVGTLVQALTAAALLARAMPAAAAAYVFPHDDVEHGEATDLAEFEARAARIVSEAAR